MPLRGYCDCALFFSFISPRNRRDFGPHRHRCSVPSLLRFFRVDWDFSRSSRFAFV